MIGKVVYNLLSTNSSVTELTSNRIAFDAAEQNEHRLTGIVIEDIAGDYENTLDGETTYLTGIIRIVCLSPIKRTAEELATVVYNALHNQRGTIKGVKLATLLASGRSDIPRQAQGGEGKTQYGVAVDFDYTIRA